MSTSALTQWLQQVLEHAQILSRNGWANALGLKPAMIAQYCSGDAFPTARTLRDLIHIVQAHEAEEARRCSERWNELALRPLREVHPTARSDSPTLGHMVVQPLWDDHRIAVAALPAHEQELLLQGGISEATRWVIARNRADAGLPMVLDDCEAWTEELDDPDGGAADSPPVTPTESAAAPTAAPDAAPMAAPTATPAAAPTAAPDAAPMAAPMAAPDAAPMAAPMAASLAASAAASDGASWRSAAPAAPSATRDARHAASVNAATAAPRDDRDAPPPSPDSAAAPQRARPPDAAARPSPRLARASDASSRSARPAPGGPGAADAPPSDGPAPGAAPASERAAGAERRDLTQLARAWVPLHARLPRRITTRPPPRHDGANPDLRVDAPPPTGDAPSEDPE